MRALRPPPEDYAVFGSAPLLAHGLITQVGDVDILATGAAWERAQELGASRPAPGGDWVVRLAPDIDIYNGWLGLDAEAVIRRAQPLDGVPVAALSDVAAYKRLLDRPKDRQHLRLIEAYLTR